MSNRHGHMKGVRIGIYPPIQQADAVLSQADPVSTTLYTVLATTLNVRVTSIFAQITWATTQPTPLEIVVTIDGISMVFLVANPVSATGYLAAANPTATAPYQVLAPNFTTGGTVSPLLIPFLLEGRSVKVEARITWAVTQPTPLVARVKYAKW